MAPLLAVSNVEIAFGGVTALQDVSFEVAAGQTCGLIGPNGAGKTTLFNCVSRLYSPRAGDIVFDGRSVIGLPAYRMAALGIGRAFQNLALFPALSALENVMIGSHARMSAGFVGSALGLPRVQTEEARIRRSALEMLDLIGMADSAEETVRHLPFGRQKRIELARALAQSPKLLMLDEPAAGLNPAELGEFQSLIQKIRAQLDLSILLIEHHLGLVMSLCDKVVALNFGRKIAEGTPAEVKANAEVVRAYLGDAP